MSVYEALSQRMGSPRSVVTFLASIGPYAKLPTDGSLIFTTNAELQSRLQKLAAEVVTPGAMSDAEKSAAAEAAFHSASTATGSREIGFMIAAVHAWKAPDDGESQGLKKAVMSALEDARRRTSEAEYDTASRGKESGSEYCWRRIAELSKEIAETERAIADDAANVAAKNAWVAKLLDSLPGA